MLRIAKKEETLIHNAFHILGCPPEIDLQRAFLVHGSELVCKGKLSTA
jgi:hypothetical protein